MKGEITVEATANANKRNKKLTFKNNALFRSCISEINNTFIDMQKILTLLHRCIICQNIVTIIL